MMYASKQQKNKGVRTFKHEVEKTKAIFRHKIVFDPGIVVRRRSVEKLAGRRFLALRGVVCPCDDGDHSDGLRGDAGPHEPVGPALVGPRHAAHPHPEDDCRTQAANRHERVLLELIHLVLGGASLRNIVRQDPVQLGLSLLTPHGVWASLHCFTCP